MLLIIIVYRYLFSSSIAIVFRHLIFSYIGWKETLEYCLASGKFIRCLYLHCSILYVIYMSSWDAYIFIIVYIQFHDMLMSWTQYIISELCYYCISIWIPICFEIFLHLLWSGENWKWLQTWQLLCNLTHISTALLTAMLHGSEIVKSYGDLTHWGRDKMADIFQTFSNTFSWMKMYEFCLDFTEVCF